MDCILITVRVIKIKLRNVNAYVTKNRQTQTINADIDNNI